MDPPMQDEDFLWRRAFADSMGLFDNLSYGPLPTCPIHNSVLPSSDSMVQDPILASPQPGNINAALVPSPALDFTLPVAQQAMLPCPTLAGSPMDELPPLAPHPVPGAVGGLGSSVRARNGVDVPVQEQSEAVSAAQAASRQASDEDAHQASTGPVKHVYGEMFFLVPGTAVWPVQQKNMDGWVPLATCGTQETIKKLKHKTTNYSVLIKTKQQMQRQRRRK